MSGITLSAAVRSNLLSLQNTAALLDTTQTRLATGNKVNSALDNPTSYFTASALTSRASDLGGLLDSVSNAIQTIQAANDGITSIQKLVESAQATANQAQQLSETVGANGVTAAAQTSDLSSLTVQAVHPASAASVTGIAIPDNTVDASTYITPGMSMTIDNGTDTQTFDFYDTTDGPYTGSNNPIIINGFDIEQEFTLGGLTSLLNGLGGSWAQFSMTAASGHLVASLDPSDLTHSLTISGSAATALGVAGTFGPQPAVTSGQATAGNVTINGQTISLANGDTSAAILAKFQAAATATSGTNTFTVSSAGGRLSFTGTSGNDLDVGGDAQTLAALSLSSGTINGTPANGPNPARAALVGQYNSLLDQIDQLTKDAGYNGNNLLAGASTQLKVVFNETGSSSLTISGKDTSTTGLSLAHLGSTDFDTNASITSILGTLKDAQDTLRADASSFGSNLSIVQTRQDFTKALINTLQTGASNLTLADSNEEAANLLALQTRQSLSTKALSLASQSDQNVLRLLQ